MRYTELRCKSNFSFLLGASHPHELIETAHRLGYSGLSLTDMGSVAGSVRAHTAAKDIGFSFIVGTEINLCDGPSLVIWPINRSGYGRMCRLISRGRTRAEKGSYTLSWRDVYEFNEDLIAGVAAPKSGVVNREQFLSDLNQFREVFDDRAYLLGEAHRSVDDFSALEHFEKLSRETKLPLVATGNVHYHIAERMLVHDCVTAIRNGTTISRITEGGFSNSQYHLRRLSELKGIYGSFPDTIARTEEIRSRCQFSLDELRYEYPEELAPNGITQLEHLKRLTWEGAKSRWPDGVPKQVINLLRHELSIIKDLNYEAYFLTVWDLVRFARQQNILCQGRGSAANSAVCYCLGITNVDPSQSDVLFERFISRERNEAPDIDVDFEHQRREEVLQYLYAKYGRDRAGMTATVISYRTRSAVREVGKALGLSGDTIDAITKLGNRDDSFREQCIRGGLDPTSSIGQRFTYLVETLTGFPRHLSQHVGGMVMTSGKLCELCPIENASMDDRTIIQWNKDDLDELGILKVDILALGMLSAIHRCFDLIKKHHNHDLSLANIPPDDTRTYEMICRADTVGVFQIESRAQMSMLPRLRPKCFYDLVVEVAIVRPGPIQGNMVHPYLQARQNPQAVTYPNDEIKKVLEKTLGVPIFQEQAMRLAVVAAGFTPGEADQLRRAMAAWRRPGVIEEFRAKLLDGMRKSNLPESFAEHIFNQIRGFGEYGFPESHAASFALLVYASCYLKCHYPAAFCAALLNSQPMGFYAPAQLVSDAQKHGVVFLKTDINFSEWDCTLESASDVPEYTLTKNSKIHPSSSAPTVRLGMNTIKGLHRETVEKICSERRSHGSFLSMNDFVERTKISKSSISLLADADLFTSINQDRRKAIWDSLDQEISTNPQPLLDALPFEEVTPEGIVPMSKHEEVRADYQLQGLSLKGHPLTFIRPWLSEQNCNKINELSQTRSGLYVSLAGLVLVRQRPGTAKGITFVTIEDETGQANLIVHPRVWKKHIRVAQTSDVWLVKGRLEKSDSVTHVIINKIEDCGKHLQSHGLKSRNFH